MTTFLMNFLYHNVFLTSWRTFWRYDACLASWRIDDVMTIVLTSRRVLQTVSRHDLFFDYMTNLFTSWRYFYVITSFYVFYEIVVYHNVLLTSWRTFWRYDNLFDVTTCFTTWRTFDVMKHFLHNGVFLTSVLIFLIYTFDSNSRKKILCLVCFKCKESWEDFSVVSLVKMGMIMSHIFHPFVGAQQCRWLITYGSVYVPLHVHLRERIRATPCTPTGAYACHSVYTYGSVYVPLRVHLRERIRATPCTPTGAYTCHSVYTYGSAYVPLRVHLRKRIRATPCTPTGAYTCHSVYTYGSVYVPLRVHIRERIRASPCIFNFIFAKLYLGKVDFNLGKVDFNLGRLKSTFPRLKSTFPRLKLTFPRLNLTFSKIKFNFFQD